MDNSDAQSYLVERAIRHHLSYLKRWLYPVTQPCKIASYLHGDYVWLLSDASDLLAGYYYDRRRNRLSRQDQGNMEWQWRCHQEKLREGK